MPPPATNNRLTWDTGAVTRGTQVADNGYVRITFNPKDFEKVNEVLGGDFEESDLMEGRFDEGSVGLEIDEAYDGLEEERKKLTELGIVYEGYHDPVGEKDAILFVSINGESTGTIECDTNLDKYPMAKIYPDGTVCEIDQVRARMYWRHIDKIEKTQYGHE